MIREETSGSQILRKNGRRFREKIVRKAFGGFFQDSEADRITHFIDFPGWPKGMKDRGVERHARKVPAIFPG